MAIAVERDVSPKRGATIKLETRADVAEFYSALVGGQVKAWPRRSSSSCSPSSRSDGEGGGVSPSTMVTGQATGTILRRVAN
jgi:hypothetical protein